MTDAVRRNAIHANNSKKGAEKNRAFLMTPLATAVIAALSPAGVVVAQDDDTVRLDEIIVTATKRELNLQDVPHNIDVLTAVDMERMGAKSLEDAIKALPSVSLNNTVPGRNSIVPRSRLSLAWRVAIVCQTASSCRSSS